MKPPSVVAVTVTFNAGDDWEPFLACVTAQRGVDWHLVVIDNLSRDRTRDRLQTITNPRITVIMNDANVGVAAANNQGIAVTLDRGADHVLLLNNDTEFADDLFAGLAASLDANAADAVSPLIPYYDRPDAVWFGGGRFTRALGILNVHDHVGAPLSAVPAKPFAIDYAPTCCLQIRREVFERIGTMDEEYFVYWDDTDFCWRMHTAGLRIVLDPGLRLLHKVSRSTGGNFSDFTIRYAQRNQIMFVRKHFSAFWLAYTALVSVGLGGYFWMAGRTNLRQFGLRLKALREGLMIPVTRRRDRMELEAQ